MLALLEGEMVMVAEFEKNQRVPEAVKLNQQYRRRLLDIKHQQATLVGDMLGFAGRCDLRHNTDSRLDSCPHHH